MPWPSYILEAFEAIPGGVDRATDESLFYGPYNALLSLLFPPTNHYMVSPQLKRPPQDWTVDFSTIFIVYSAKHSIFFLEVRPPTVYAHRSSRAVADSQMRSQIFDLADIVQIPMLYGLSALGTRLCFYSYQSANNTVTPARLKTTDESFINDVAPADWWNCDLLSEDGFTKLTAVSNDIKDMVAHYNS